jgi:hypothetical protein
MVKQLCIDIAPINVDLMNLKSTQLRHLPFDFSQMGASWGDFVRPFSPVIEVVPRKIFLVRTWQRQSTLAELIRCTH